MLSCWLCTGLYHLKCTGGLKARDADALAEKGKCLQWTCHNCRKISVEFYNMFKNTHEEFDNITKEFTVLQSKLSKYGELFNKFHNLDEFAQPKSPKRKKTSGPASSSVLNAPIPANLDPIENNAAPSQPNTIGYTTPNPSTESFHAPIPPVSTNAATMQLNNDTNLNPNENHMSSVNLFNNQTNNRQLRIHPPKKSIFISRFDSETTEDDIDYYIKNKLNINADVFTKKFTYSQPRSVISFKLTVPHELFDTIMEPRFWPDNTLVREFEIRENKRPNNTVRVPSCNQKN